MNAVRQTLLDAAEHHRAGRLAAAEPAYRAVLDALPDQADALHLLGVLCHQTGRHAEAVALIERAIAIDASSADFHSNLGEARRALGDNAAAEADYRRALALRPDSPEVLSNLGLVLCELNRAAGAAASLRRAVALKPDFALAHDNLGIALQKLDDLEAAAASHSRAIALAPGYAKAHNHLGNVHFARANMAAAIDCYNRAFALDPGYAQAHYNLGNALLTQLKDSGTDGGLTDVRERFARALALKPGYVDAEIGMAAAWRLAGEMGRAIEILLQVTARQPDNAFAHYSLALAYAADSQWAASDAAMDRSIALDPNHRNAWDERLLNLHYWPTPAAGDVRRAHDAFDAVFGAPAMNSRQTHSNGREPERRLRIGYVSPDFRQHVCAFIAAQLFGAHDRQRVEVFAYAEVAKPDWMTDKIKAAVDHWRTTVGRSDDDVAGMVRADRIDILVDLAGHTGGNRLPVFARKPAPVQATWLGYPDTTGLKAIDYVVMDDATAPRGSEHLFSERVVRLPHGRFTYVPPPYTPPVAARDTPRDTITFGSFNNLWKVNPDVVALWARVLAAVPQSRLVLKWATLGFERIRRTMVEQFAAHGIGESRLDLRGASPHDGMLAQYGDIDIALDPFPYSGGLTTLEALWMGVPVVTWPGERPVSRQSLAFLNELGLRDLVADSPDSYVAIARGLAGDGTRRRELRGGMRERFARSSLMDYAGFARSVEAAYRDMWRRWCAEAA